MRNRGSDPDPDRQASFLEEEAAEGRRFLPGQMVRWGIAFGLLFSAVFFFFWWSGSAFRFGAARVAEKPVASWKVAGFIRNALTGEPVPWAVIRDDPGGRPPFFRTDSDHRGAFELLTLAESHSIRVEAAGYRSQTVQVGRHWFVWWPYGEEKIEIRLQPD